MSRTVSAKMKCLVSSSRLSSAIHSGSVIKGISEEEACCVSLMCLLLKPDGTRGEFASDLGFSWPHPGCKSRLAGDVAFFAERNRDPRCLVHQPWTYSGTEAPRWRRPATNSRPTCRRSGDESRDEINNAAEGLAAKASDMAGPRRRHGQGWLLSRQGSDRRSRRDGARGWPLRCRKVAKTADPQRRAPSGHGLRARGAERRLDRLGGHAPASAPQWSPTTAACAGSSPTMAALTRSRPARVP